MKTIYLKFLLVMASLLATASLSLAQGFNNAHGLAGNDEFRTLVRLPGDDYIVAGAASQNGGDLYIARYTSTDALVWETTYGNAGVEIATTSALNSNGNILIAGTTTSFSTVGNGLQDILVLEIDPNGILQWVRSYGRDNDLNDIPNNINLTAGGIGICGLSVPQFSSSPDMLAMEISSDGSTINWQNRYDNVGDIGYQLISSTTGGYILIGGSDASGRLYDQILLRLNATGNIVSGISYGSGDNENAHQIVALPGGDVIVMGNYRSLSGGGLEFALTRIAPDNSIVWSRTYGDNAGGNERSFSFIQTNDGGYAIAGQTSGFGLGNNDILVVVTDAAGIMTQSFSVGQQGNDFPYDIVQNGDGSFTIAGFTTSFGSGTTDAYLIGTNVQGQVVGNCSTANPVQRAVTPTIGNITFTVSNPGFLNEIPAINSSPVTLTVVSQVALSINGISQICIGNSSSFTTSRPASNVTWAVTSGNATIASQSGTNITLNFTTAGVITLTATLGSCVATHQITVNPNPVLAFVGLNNAYCVGSPETINLAATPAGGTITVDGTPATTLSTAVAGTYEVGYSYTNANGCPGTISQNVVINPLPVVSIIGLESTYCSGYYNIALTGAPVGGTFTVNGVTQTVFEPSVIGIYTIVYTYTNANGCTNSATIITEVTDCCKYKIGEVTGTCGATNTLCVPLTATMPVDKGIIGLDYCLQYDPAIMVPTGTYTLGTLVTKGNATWANAFLNTNTPGQVRASIHYTSNAPAGTLFQGSGEVICIQFRLLATAPLGTSVLSSCELEEAYKLTEKTACWEAGSITIGYDVQLRGRLIYQGNTNKTLGMNYTVNQNSAVTNISGTDGSCVSNTVDFRPNAAGNFTLPVTNSSHLKIVRDIKTPPNNTTYATMRYVNGYDTYLMQNITTQRTTGANVVLPTAYMMIAADVNMNDKVRANDITLVQERIVRKISEYPQVWNSAPNPAALSLDWRYIDKRTVDNDLTFKRSTTYPIADGSGFYRDDVPNVPFCLPVKRQCLTETPELYSGILLGDLFDGGPLSYNPQSYPNSGSDPYLKQAAPNAKEATSNLVNFEVDDITALGDNLYRVFVKHGGLSTQDTLISIDFAISYDKKEISVIDLGRTAECGQSDVSMMWNDSEDGEIILTSFSMNTYPSEGTLFYIDILKTSGRPVASDFNTALAFLNGVEVGTGVNLRSSITTEVTSSITENAVSIVPNPATDAATIYYTFSKSANAKIEVLNSLGQTVANYTGLSAEGSVSLNVGALAKGVYHCIISDGANKVVKKLVVQ